MRGVGERLLGDATAAVVDVAGGPAGDAPILVVGRLHDNVAIAVESVRGVDRPGSVAPHAQVELLLQHLVKPVVGVAARVPGLVDRLAIDLAGGVVRILGVGGSDDVVARVVGEAVRVASVVRRRDNPS